MFSANPTAIVFSRKTVAVRPWSKIVSNIFSSSLIAKAYNRLSVIFDSSILIILYIDNRRYGNE